MTQQAGPRPGQETRSAGNNSSRSYTEGTTGLELRDKVLARLREAGHQPYTNSEDGYLWFMPCPNHSEMVRVSSGSSMELACLTWRQDERCTTDDLVVQLGLENLIQVTTTYVDQLRAALVDSVGLDHIPDPDPLIGEDIVFQDSLVWMVGKPGSGKSFVALDLAACVGTGEVWQGYRVTQGQVLFLVAEGVRGTKKRVRAWEESMGRPMTGVTFLPLAVQSKVPFQWDALIEVVQELKPIMIILDTQARITTGVEENSNTAMGEFIGQVEELRKAAGSTVVLVHHIGREGNTGRGATTVVGAVATIIKVTKADDQVTLECQKNKDGEEWDDIVLRTVPMGESLVLAVDEEGRRKTRTELLAQKWLAAWWKTFEGESVSVTTLVESGVVSKSTFHRTKLDLINDKLVEREGRGNAVRYRLTVNPSTGVPG